MSTISSVGGNQGLYQFLRALSSKQQAAAAQKTQAAGVQDSDGDSDGSGGAQGTNGVGGHHGGGLLQQIAAAVTNALQSSQSDPTATSSADPNKVIQDAIAQVLSGGLNPSTGDTSASSTTTQSAAGGQTTPQAFQQLLQSVGVDSQQFRADFMAALQQVKGGSLDPNAALQQTLPPGSAVDVLA